MRETATCPVQMLLLGPVEAAVSGRAVNLGRRQERALLSILAVRPGYFMSTDQLTDLLWDGRPPDRARSGIQAMVSHLRAALRTAGAPGSPLAARGGSYALAIEPDGIDLHRFRRLVADADASTGLVERTRLLRQALGLWRGVPMSDTLSAQQTARVDPGLDEMYIGARESLLDIQVKLGGYRAAIGDLTSLVAEQPLREHPVELLMTALHRSGRSGEALAAYAALAKRLAEGVSIDPGERLRRLHLAILRDETSHRSRSNRQR